MIDFVLLARDLISRGQRISAKDAITRIDEELKSLPRNDCAWGILIERRKLLEERLAETT